MIVKTQLSEIQDELSRQFDEVTLKGQGRASFLRVVHDGRGVEISENDETFWLEFWEKSDDEDAAPVKELTVATAKQVIQETKRWLA